MKPLDDSDIDQFVRRFAWRGYVSSPAAWVFYIAAPLGVAVLSIHYGLGIDEVAGLRIWGIGTGLILGGLLWFPLYYMRFRDELRVLARKFFDGDEELRNKVLGSRSE